MNYPTGGESKHMHAFFAMLTFHPTLRFLEIQFIINYTAKRTLLII